MTPQELLIAGKAATSLATQHLVKSEVLKMLAPLNISLDSVGIDYDTAYAGNITACAMITDCTKPDYLAMLSSIHTSVSIRRLEYNARKTIQLVTHGIAIHIVFGTYVDLREDDLATLTMLGKVHTEVVPARIVETVYCEV